jgi:hypothetical protein
MIQAASMANLQACAAPIGQWGEAEKLHKRRIFYHTHPVILT